ncbi:MAG: MmcQ/YjbR family DNA-binding protein [Cytophagaceae bacterium]|nr:MmcQ/YjbR family DNA-binding protein [Cytophagaceae bacterium]
MTTQQFHELALSFPGTEDNPHFDRIAYTVTGKKIFASVHEESQSANLKLSVADQAVFSKFDKAMVYPVPNKFGLQGWTTFELKKAPIDLMKEALHSSYKEAIKVIPKKK